MGKKKMYGDIRYLYPELFANDVETLEKLKNTEKEREELETLYESYIIPPPKSGEMARVTFLGISQNYFIFDGGFKDFVRIENKPNEASYLKNTEVGDQLDVYITEINEDDFFIKASFVELYEGIARKNLTELEEGSAVVCYVRESTPAGYSVDIQFEGVSLPGFMPNTLAGINKLPNPESILGKTFDVMIESYSREEGTYIVSRRKYLQSLIPQSIRELEHGKIYLGQVTGTTEFGVFVEFNECLTGMIHKTNMNPENNIQISEISPGVNIEFYIKEIIKDKIILTQILRETLWDTIKVGQVITGKVKDIKPFGVLVTLDEETNALIHTSEMEKTNQKISPGQEVKVKVIAVDRSARKIFLSVA
jgi:ribosomal protein S1